MEQFVLVLCAVNVLAKVTISSPLQENRFLPTLNDYLKYEASIAEDTSKEDLDIKLRMVAENPSEIYSGEDVVEGDIVVPNGLLGRKAIVSASSFWPNAEVFYTFDSSVDDTTKQTIRDAISHWEDTTCLRFKENGTGRHYLRFRTDKPGCWSFLGRQLGPKPGQDVSIGSGCEYRDIVAHEIGHAIGFYHEQARRDRDKHLKILWANMEKQMQGQFSQGNDHPRGVEYDFTSVMHYSPMAFSSRLFEKNTMISKNPLEHWLIGTAKGLSFRDHKLANFIYKCNENCPNSNERCENDGYLSPYKGDNKPCSCICPPGTAGDRCETTTGSYYPPLPCGGEVTDERTIETPNYPQRQNAYESCAWHIKAPAGKKVEVTFEDFSFRRRYDKETSKYKGFCVKEKVEIRTSSMEDGEMYCGTDIAPGTKMTSSSNEFVIIILADDKKEGKGLKANVKFV